MTGSEIEQSIHAEIEDYCSRNAAAPDYVILSRPAYRRLRDMLEENTQHRKSADPEYRTDLDMTEEATGRRPASTFRFISHFGEHEIVVFEHAESIVLLGRKPRGEKEYLRLS